MRTLFILLFSASFLCFTSCDKETTGTDATTTETDSTVAFTGKPAKMKTKLDTVSYLFGYNNAKGWKQQGLENMNMDIFVAAMDHAIDGSEPQIDMQEAGTYVGEYINELRAELGEKNQKESEEFLAKNAKVDGMQTTESGLQYLVIEEGTGATPTRADKVEIDYHGTTVDGEVFDSSVDKGQRATFRVTQLVPGFTEALLLMKEGAKYKVFLPAELAYGERGTPNISPNEVITFEIDLYKVITPEVVAPAE